MLPEDSVPSLSVDIWGPQLGPEDGGAPLCYHSDGLSLSAVSPAFHPQNHGELNDSRSYHGDELVSVLLGPLMEAVSGSNLQGTGKAMSCFHLNKYADHL